MCICSFISHVPGAGIGSFCDSVMVVTWLAMVLWPFSLCALMLYLCILGTGVGPSSNWCGDLLMISVSSGIICGYLCGGYLIVQPRLIDTG